MAIPLTKLGGVAPRSGGVTPQFETTGSGGNELGSLTTRSRASVVGVSNDLSADALSRIRNAYFRSFQDVVIVDSKEIRELLNALVHAGYIHN